MDMLVLMRLSVLRREKMRWKKAALERFALAFQRAIENTLTGIIKGSEVHVSVVVKPQEEKSRGRIEGNPTGSGGGHP